ncbi:MAG: hypothetical protein KGQ93_02740 [Cyanobacteria bacterium REEB459]|nr:hypothetical protein [Cyanobacteria bacterium REEB459]
MSQQGSFVGGFLFGALVGAALGGVVGVLATSRTQAPKSKGDLSLEELDLPTEDSMEAARLGLESKIAQLNEAIDEVRQQLGSINTDAEPAWDASSRLDS